MNYGYQNEVDFVKYFNNKYIDDFDLNSQKFLKELFDQEIDSNEIIKCYKNRMVQKADIFIKYKNFVKGISLKCGNSNSMHHEQVQEFKRYLGNIGIPYNIIEYYMSYHFGHKRDINNCPLIETKLSSEEYKKLYQDELDIFNKYINKTRIIVDMIDRFIVHGRNSDFDISALICGTVNNYIWILKDDIYDLILSKKSVYLTSPHISILTIGPKKRLIESDTRVAEKYQVCIRWFNLEKDILEYKRDVN